MKLELKLISINRASAFQLDPSLIGPQAIVLRALVAGQTDRQACNELRMSPATFLRMRLVLDAAAGISIPKRAIPAQGFI